MRSADWSGHSCCVSNNLITSVLVDLQDRGGQITRARRTYIHIRTQSRARALAVKTQPQGLNLAHAWFPLERGQNYRRTEWRSIWALFPDRRTNRSAVMCQLPNKQFCSVICWFASSGDDREERGGQGGGRRRSQRTDARRGTRTSWHTLSTTHRRLYTTGRVSRATGCLMITDASVGLDEETG